MIFVRKWEKLAKTTPVTLDCHSVGREMGESQTISSTWCLF